MKILRALRRKSTDPYYATLEMKPGATRLDLTHAGVLVGRMVLSRFDIDSQSGRSAEFVDLGQAAYATGGFVQQRRNTPCFVEPVFRSTDVRPYGEEINRSVRALLAKAEMVGVARREKAAALKWFDDHAQGVWESLGLDRDAHIVRGDT